jgi:hypothetical protein
MGDQLLPLPLTERSVHLCVDMQRIFSTEPVMPRTSRNAKGAESRRGHRSSDQVIVDPATSRFFERIVWVIIPIARASSLGTTSCLQNKTNIGLSS